MRLYTVPIYAEYNVAVEKDDATEADALAQKEIKAALNNVTEETNVFVTNIYRALFYGYIVKVAANMVIDVKAGDYLQAFKEAEKIIESLHYKNEIRLIFTGSYDTELKAI